MMNLESLWRARRELTEQEIIAEHRARCTPEMIELYELFAKTPDNTGWMINGLEPVDRDSTDRRDTHCGCGREADYIVLGPDYPFCVPCLREEAGEPPVRDVAGDLLAVLTASVAAARASRVR
jgi:hypothetical protein